MTGSELALLNVIEGAGALVQATLGFGINLVAAPLLALVDPALVPVPTLMVGVLSALYVAACHRKDPPDKPGLRWALSGQVPGAAVGAVAITLLPLHAYRPLFAVLVLAAVVITSSRWQPRITSHTLVSVGMLSGFLSASSSVGGAPMALVYQRSPGRALRSTLARYNALSGTASLTLLAMSGDVHWSSGKLAVALVPGLVAGSLVARFTRDLVDRPWMRPAVLGVVALSAAVLLALTV